MPNISFSLPVMVYTILKYLIQTALHSYFKTIRVSGIENVPKKGPIIFVANHPSTLMDPVVIGAIVKPQIYFLAAAEFMGKGLMQWLMGYLFNMIPIYRKETQPGKESKNEDVFRKCYQHLAKNGSILIFPEGQSITQKRLLPLKTGAARIAIGAEKNAPVRVQIIPIGLNYTDPHTFQSDLFVRIGKSITTSEPELLGITDDFDKAKALTAIIETRLKEQLIHLEDEKLDAVFGKIKTIASHEVYSSSTAGDHLISKFYLQKNIQEKLHFYYQKHPEIIDIINQKLDHYLQRATFYGVSDTAISRPSSKITWTDYSKIILGIPLFVIGYAGNALPYYATLWVFRRFKIDPSFHGSIGLSLGLILYLIWYITWGVFIAKISAWWVGIAVVFVIHVAGRFTLNYLSLIITLRKKGHLNRLLKRNRNIVESLKHERDALITEIQMYAEWADTQVG